MTELKHLGHLIRDAEVPIKFSTANGSPPLATKCIDLKCWEIDHPDVQPYILAGTPPVMSIGMRVMQYGYDFIWLGSKKLPPYYITPSGRIVVMEVIDDIPYIRSGDAQCQPQVATRTIRVRAVPAPEENLDDDGLFHDLPDPTSLEVGGEAPPTSSAPSGAAVQGDSEGPVSSSEGACPNAAPTGEVVPPPPDAPANVEESEGTRRDLKAEAKSTRHLLTHKPFNPHCDGCKVAKMREKSHFKGAFKREIKKWGEVVTADHLVSKRGCKKRTWVGCTGDTNALNIKDLWSKLISCYPVKDKGHE